MKPAPFAYFRPETLAELLELLAEHADAAKLLAGGQSLIPMMNLRLAQPSVLIDVCGIDELGGISRNGSIEIGASTRQVEALTDPDVAAAAPLLPEALSFVGHAANRNRGTVGGSLAHADPAAELPAVALALGASMDIRGSNGTRTVAADDFFESYLTTAVAADEVLTKVHFPAADADASFGFYEVSRRHGDFALVGSALTVRLDANRNVGDARIALFGVADRAIRAGDAEKALVGQPIGDADLPKAVAAIAARDLDPPFDQQASSRYRQEVAAIAVERALRGCVARLEGNR